MESDPDIFVRVLGPVELRVRGEVVNLGEPASALAYLLAMKGEATAYQVHAALWPTQRPEGSTASANRNKATSILRTALGPGTDGTPLVPHVEQSAGLYRLHRSTLTDWDVFRDLVPDLRTTSTERLVAALKLVRGRPFSAVNERWYGWAELERFEITDTIVDTAHELVQRSLCQGNVSRAQFAATVARTVDPASELSLTDSLESEYAARNEPALARLLSYVEEVEEVFGDEWLPETQAVLSRVRAAEPRR